MPIGSGGGVGGKESFPGRDILQSQQLGFATKQRLEDPIKRKKIFLRVMPLVSHSD
jgi:hypothetical protein